MLKVRKEMVAGLSEREVDVLRLLSHGLTPQTNGC